MGISKMKFNMFFLLRKSLFFRPWSFLALLASLLGTTRIVAQDKSLLAFFEKQAMATVAESIPASDMPVVVEKGNINWSSNNISNWRSGFWPGIEWYLYEATKKDFWKEQAEKSTGNLQPILDKPVSSHDLGFQFYCSYGNGLRLTGNPVFKQVMLRAADSLATLFNPQVGTILSWPYRRKDKGWPHNTIIDNMMNLELLFWASKNGGSKKLYDIAVSHATVTMKNHFRPDFSSYHVLVYDDKNGAKIKEVTHQGYADSSMWARGQAWAVYGFTMAFRETGKQEFLQTAIKAANIYLKRLPKDFIPYWDFDDPMIPDAPRDASAAAIMASALLELSTFVGEVALKDKYFNAAKAMLIELSTGKYLAEGKNHAFLLHSTGNKPSGKDIDVPIIYADYYFLEALLRLEKLK
jgi:unsaturated chondroitin disaccharide hydrolase